MCSGLAPAPTAPGGLLSESQEQGWLVSGVRAGQHLGRAREVFSPIVRRRCGPLLVMWRRNGLYDVAGSRRPAGCIVGQQPSQVHLDVFTLRGNPPTTGQAIACFGWAVTLPGA